MSAPGYRVWLGYRQPGDWARFVDNLRKTFAPVTWQVMGRFNLLAYVPSVLSENQAADLPDETALLVYQESADYERAKGTVAGRAYGLLHSAVFNFSDAQHRSTSDWASTYPEPPGDKLPAWLWPATKGPSFTDEKGGVVYLVIRHPPDALPEAIDVHNALGPVDGELVICRAKALSFVWLAAYDAKAADAIGQVTQSRPAWKVEAAHDAARARCDPDPFATVTQEIELGPNQTLQFIR